MKRLLISFLLSILLSIGALTAPFHQGLEAAEAADFDHSQSAFDVLLMSRVEDGKADNKDIKNEPEKLDKYLSELAGVNETDYSSWSRDEKVAFWINAYNAFTIKAIVDNYPIKGGRISLYPRNSIRQIKGVWNELKFEAAGREVTLNHIEHKILRAEFKEPRIHFAIVCASVGCPKLDGKAFKAAALDEQLDDSAKRFINDPEKVRVIAEKNQVELSKIFKWFGTDFIEKYGTREHFKNRSKRDRAVLNVVSMNLKNKDLKKVLAHKRLKISYLNYDWSLNEQH